MNLVRLSSRIEKKPERTLAIQPDIRDHWPSVEDGELASRRRGEYHQETGCESNMHAATVKRRAARGRDGAVMLS